MRLEISENGQELLIHIPLKRVFEDMEQHKIGTLNEGIFTIREREALKQMLLGKCNKEIACAMNIAERTAKYYASNIFAKTRMCRSDLIRNYGTVQ